mgnify:CR=1 FL=1|jgi:hypothetical protein
MDFVANDMKFDHFIIKQWGGRFKVWGSGFGVVVAASLQYLWGDAHLRLRDLETWRLGDFKLQMSDV